MRQEKHNYDKDFYKWAYAQADLLKSKEFEKIDLQNLIEEVESLGKSEKHALESQIIRLLLHMLKIEYQPKKRTKSWDRSILNARIEIDRKVKQNPSLKKELKNLIQESFPYAIKSAALETGLDLKTFPKECPWSLKEILGE